MKPNLWKALDDIQMDGCVTLESDPQLIYISLHGKYFITDEMAMFKHCITPTEKIQV